MKKSTFTKEQMVYALRQAEVGAPVADVCRTLGISGQTFSRWKKKSAGLGVAELCRWRSKYGSVDAAPAGKGRFTNRMFAAQCLDGHLSRSL